MIVFSAAFPGQGGQNHLNEQWPEYWKNKFEKYDYELFDVLRPIFWNNESIPVWYRQNMMLVIKKGKLNQEKIVEGFSKYHKNSLMNIIHPEYFYPLLQIYEQSNNLKSEHERLKKGKESFKIYLKLMAKYILRKLNLYNK